MFQPVTRDAIVIEARAWIGTRYRHQASVKGVGCDCLGLVRGVWRNCIGTEPEMPPPYAPDWAEASGDEAMANAAMRHLVPVARDDIGGGDVLLVSLARRIRRQARGDCDRRGHDDLRP